MKSGPSKIAHTNDGRPTGISTASCIFFYDPAGSAMPVARTFSLGAMRPAESIFDAKLLLLLLLRFGALGRVVPWHEVCLPVADAA
ncbi:hypothetical protein [Variovorax paradoxus]|uniref:hypothetical protein n=1 Tax=Variovorax paradoxus TaxID=34073 RepID=UPI001ABCF3C1